MPSNGIDEEVPQLVRLRERWLQLPLSYRLNALLYFLGACALLFLVSSLILGGDKEPRQVQVGAGVASTTTTGLRLVPSTAPAATLDLPTSSTAVPSSTSSTSAAVTPAAPAVPSGGASPNPAPSQPPPTPSPTQPPSGNGGGSNTTTPPQTSPPTSATTTTTPCRDSTEARCGIFVWDPPPGPNEPLTVGVAVRPSNPRAGDTVTFDVIVDDADHLVSANCSEVRFGDGGTANGPCTPPPECPPRYGPWTPPARKTGHFTVTYTHVYQGAAIFPARFTFKSWGDTCLGLDPYASVGEREVLVTVAPAAP